MRPVSHINTYTCLLALLLLFTTSSPVSAQEQMDASTGNDSIELSWTDSVKLKLQHIAGEADSSYYTTGIYVFDLTSDSLVFAYNQQKQLHPASTQKLFTAIAALDKLGARHCYTTSVYAKGSISTDTLGQNVLNGNIYIVGDFDPKLDASSMEEMASSIKNLGISRIEGMLVADLSMKDTVMLGNGWCWDDKQPMLTPLSMGGDAYLCTKDRINKYNPAAEFLFALRHKLGDNGISVQGCGIGDCLASDSCTLVCCIKHSIDDVLPRMMKESDNLYAESMFYQLAADTKKHVGWKDCKTVVEDVAAAAGATVSDIRIVDGCGLSFYNYTTVAAEVSMLRYAYKKGGSVFSPLYESLPVAGVDGTLKNRMKIGKTLSNIHAKTGSLTGVSSLAGYLTAANGHTLAFSIISNSLKKAAEGRTLQDRICRILCE